MKDEISIKNKHKVGEKNSIKTRTMIPAKCRSQWKKMEKKDEIAKIMPIKTIEPEMISIVMPGEWEEIKLSVDSGANESVVPPEFTSSIPTMPGPASKRGVEYKVANGERIPNEGEKKFQAVVEEGAMKNMVVQLCDVNQGLLSVSKVTGSWQQSGI